MEDLITEKYNKLDLLIEAIGDAESLSDTAAVAIELYKTLGFCHGFLGRSLMVFPEPDSSEFPWDSKVWYKCSDAYDFEFGVGAKLHQEMETENES